MELFCGDDIQSIDVGNSSPENRRKNTVFGSFSNKKSSKKNRRNFARARVWKQPGDADMSFSWERP